MAGWIYSTFYVFFHIYNPPSTSLSWFWDIFCHNRNYKNNILWCLIRVWNFVSSLMVHLTDQSTNYLPLQIYQIISLYRSSNKSSIFTDLSTNYLPLEIYRQIISLCYVSLNLISSTRTWFLNRSIINSSKLRVWYISSSRLYKLALEGTHDILICPCKFNIVSFLSPFHKHLKNKNSSW